MFENLIKDFQEEILSSSSLSELENCLNIFTKRIGFDIYTYTTVHEKSFQEISVHIMCNWPRYQVDHYCKKKFERIDPVIIHHLESPSMLYHSYFHDNYKEFSSDIREWFDDMVDFKNQDGISVGIHGYGREKALLCWNSNLINLQTRSLTKEASFYIVQVAHIFHQQALKFLSSRFYDSNVLTNREKDCLRWGAEGKTNWEIGMILNISEHTVSKHFYNAAKKLKASNRVHAIAIAVAHDMLKPNNINL